LENSWIIGYSIYLLNSYFILPINKADAPIKAVVVNTNGIAPVEKYFLFMGTVEEFESASAKNNFFKSESSSSTFSNSKQDLVSKQLSRGSSFQSLQLIHFSILIYPQPNNKNPTNPRPTTIVTGLFRIVEMSKVDSDVSSQTPEGRRWIDSSTSA